MMATRRSGSSPKAVNASPIAWLVAESMALAPGRSSTTSSTPPSRVRRSGPSSDMRSSPQRPQQLSGDDVPLYLAGAVPDSLHAGIAPEPLEGQLVHQSHAAEDLNRPVRDARQHLGGVELRLRDLTIGLAILIETPGGGEGQIVGGVDLRDHVGQLKGDALELTDLLTELPALGGVAECELEGAAGATHGRRADRQPGPQPPRGCDIESAALLAEDLRRRHPAVLEAQRAVVVAAMRHRGVARPDLYTGRTAVDEEAGDPLLRSFIRLVLPRRGEDDDEVGDVGVADEVFGAIDDPAVAVCPCQARHATQVRPGAGL